MNPLYTPTPAPWQSIVATPIVNVSTLDRQFAIETVQGYNYINQSGALDTLWLVATALIVVAGLIIIYKMLKAANPTE